MAKNNPFYHFLRKYHKVMIQALTDKHGDNFLLLSLAAPEQTEFNFEGIPLEFREHHITVYEVINEEVGFQSAYHYTLSFNSGHIVHIYFQENGTFISATLENPLNREIKIINDFFDGELFFIHELLEDKVKPMLLNFFEQHTALIDDQKKRYLVELDTLKKNLYDSPTEISANLTLVQKLITKGETLKSLSYRQNFAKKSLTFLHGCETALKNAIQARSKSKTKVVVSSVDKQPDKLEVKVVSSSASSNSKTKTTVKKASLEQDMPTFIKETAQFEEAYQQFVKQLTAFELSKEELHVKLQQFANISQEALINLNSTAVVLLSLIPIPTIEQQVIFNKASLDVNLFNEKMDEFGCSLLLACFQSAPLLQQYKPLLAKYVIQLNHHHLEDAIRCRNLPVVAFLLEHGKFNLNDVHIRITKKGAKIPALCMSFKANDIDLFQLLLKHHASPMVLFEGMPLAHSLMQLKVNHPFYQSFMQYYEKALNGEPRFYIFLCKAIDSKLATPTLAEKEKEDLLSAKENYQSSMHRHVRNWKLSTSGRQDFFTLLNLVKPEVRESIKNEASTVHKELFDRLGQKNKELLQLMKKRHLDKTALRYTEKAYKKAAACLDEQKSAWQVLTEKDCLDSIKSNLEATEAAIDYLNLYNKASRTKQEEVKLKDAKAILQDNFSAANDAMKFMYSSGLNMGKNNASNNQQDLSSDDEFDEIEDFVTCAERALKLENKPHPVNFFTAEGLYQPISDRQLSAAARDDEPHPIFEASDFLHDVAKGRQEEAASLLTAAPDNTQTLLRMAGVFTDYSGRTFNCTAYEYAYWAKDTHMCRMLESHMDEETKALIAARIDNIERIDPTTGNPVGLIYRQLGEEHRSAHFDFTPLIKAYRTYLDGCDCWSGIGHWHAMQAAWMVVGKAQRNVPAHVAQEYCRRDRSFSPKPEFNDATLPRILTFLNNDTEVFESWFPLASSNSGLGFDFSLARGPIEALNGTATDKGKAEELTYVIAIDFEAIAHLDQIRTVELQVSRENLKPLETSLSVRM